MAALGSQGGSAGPCCRIVTRPPKDQVASLDKENRPSYCHTSGHCESCSAACAATLRPTLVVAQSLAIRALILHP